MADVGSLLVHRTGADIRRIPNPHGGISPVYVRQLL